MDFGKLFSKVVKTVKDSIEADQRQNTTTAQPKPTPQPANRRGMGDLLQRDTHNGIPGVWLQGKRGRDQHGWLCYR